MAKTINLPKPNKDGSISLEQAISTRRSRRKFSPKPFTLQQISQLTWAAQGKDDQSRFRTVPSAGAKYPLELFAVTANGLFHYLPNAHSLEQLEENDLRTDLAIVSYQQSFMADAALTLVFTAQFCRTTEKYGQRGHRYVYMESGHAVQNVHLQAETLGLSSVAIGAFDDDAVSKLLKLPNHLEPIYMVTVGFPKE